MKAGETQFVNFLNQNQQLIIPVYQRTYSWGINQCRQLWEDLMKVIKNNTEAHFIGSIVYVSDGLYVNTETQSYLVIDGQQRLTTISLLFLAIRDRLKTNNSFSVNERQITNQFLTNEFALQDKKNKLCLTQSDKVVFEKLLNSQKVEENEKQNKIWLNYNYFAEELNETKINLDELYSGIRRLIIVSIVLDRKNDNPQLIFESLNSTGLDLSQSDLIRNYVLMGLENKLQEKIYNEYWLPMERLFTQGVEKFDYFMRAYLTIKTKAIPRLDEVYVVFKQYTYGKDIKEIISDVYKFSEHYSNIELDHETDQEIKTIFQHIKTLKVDVSHPFLLCVYNDYKNNVLSKDQLILILKLIENYTFRRAICGVPTNSLNKTFASLYEEIDQKNYLESLQAILVLKDGYRRFPKDNEFKNELLKKDVYHSRNCLYLLFKIENYLNNNRTELDINKLSIEHIMPQEITTKWKEELGTEYERIHEEYLHTLGNLTLTGFNQEMSNKSFQEKKKDGFENSGVFLNKELLNLEKWNEEQMIKRVNSLSNFAVNIWQFPDLKEETVSKYKKVIEKKDKDVDYTIDDYEHLEGGMLGLFNQLRERIINLDPSIVKEEYKKLYIAYKADTNFVDIVPQKSRLRLSLNMEFGEINDPKELCKDVGGKGRWGNGDVEVGISSVDQINDIMFLIKQSFDKQVVE